MVIATGENPNIYPLPLRALVAPWEQKGQQQKVPGVFLLIYCSAI